MGRGRGQKSRKIKGGGAGGVGGLSLPFACLAAGLAWRLPAVRPAPAWPACAGPCRPAMAWLPCQGAGRGLGYRGLAVLCRPVLCRPVLGWLPWLSCLVLCCPVLSWPSWAWVFWRKRITFGFGGGKGKKRKGGVMEPLYPTHSHNPRPPQPLQPTPLAFPS